MMIVTGNKFNLWKILHFTRSHSLHGKICKSVLVRFLSWHKNYLWAWAYSPLPAWLPAVYVAQAETGRENLREIERGKGGRDKPRRLPAAVLPSTPRGTKGARIVQMYRQCGQLPNNVPCTDPLSQAIALTLGGWVGNQINCRPRLSTTEWGMYTVLCAPPPGVPHHIWQLIYKQSGCHCLVAGITASLTMLYHRYHAVLNIHDVNAMKMLKRWRMTWRSPSCPWRRRTSWRRPWTRRAGRRLLSEGECCPWKSLSPQKSKLADITKLLSAPYREERQRERKGR